VWCFGPEEHDLEKEKSLGKCVHPRLFQWKIYADATYYVKNMLPCQEEN